MTERETKRHGDGIYSRLSKRRHQRVYSVQYYWNGKRQTETVPREYQRQMGPTSGRKKVLRGFVAARAVKADREKQRFQIDWLPPHVAEKLRREQEANQAEQRAPLLFDVARDRFLDECADDYASRANVDSAFRILTRAFEGVLLDEVSRVDIRQYYLHRMNNTGPFADWPRKVSRRAPDSEISYLRALYTWLQDGGFAIENPCHRPTTRRKDSPLRPYRPKRQRVIPTPQQLVCLLKAKKCGKGNQKLIRSRHLALFALCWYTAARPESEPCRLRHGDVKFLSDGWAEISYNETKNDESRRTVPLHSEAVPLLRATMDEEPSRFDRGAHDRWRAKPIFRRRGSEEPWTRASYKKAWIAAVSVVEGIERMVLRDLRPAARTRLTDARVPEPTIKRFMGHSVTVSEHYYECSPEALRAAAEHLSLRKVAAEMPAGHEGL